MLLVVVAVADAVADAFAVAAIVVIVGLVLLLGCCCYGSFHQLDSFVTWPIGSFWCYRVRPTATSQEGIAVDDCSWPLAISVVFLLD